jgi:septal ring factor EnvC (AmiA/AmiB activator)
MGGIIMPRGRKPANGKSINTQISDIDAEIEEYKQKIALAKEKRKELKNRREKQEMEVLYKAVRASGKSPREFLDTLKEHADRL